MSKAEVVLIVIRSVKKYYLMQKTTTNVVSAVFKTKLRPRFIGSFTVVAKKVLAYTLNFSHILRTHPVFYVGMLKPYRDPSHVDVRRLRRGRRLCRWMKHMYQDIQLPLHPSLLLFQHLQTRLHSFRLALGLTNVSQRRFTP